MSLDDLPRRPVKKISREHFQSIMAGITGIPVEEQKALAEQVRLNLATLKGCPGPHRFEVVGDATKLGAKYRCAVCKGEVRAADKHWYEQGLAHGRANPQ